MFWAQIVWSCCVLGFNLLGCAVFWDLNCLVVLCSGVEIVWSCCVLGFNLFGRAVFWGLICLVVLCMCLDCCGCTWRYLTRRAFMSPAKPTRTSSGNESVSIRVGLSVYLWL